MPYSPPFLVAFMVPSTTSVRLVPICIQNIVKQVEVKVSSSSIGCFLGPMNIGFSSGRDENFSSA